MKRRQFLKVSAGTVGLTGLAGCGGDGDGSDDTTTTETTTTQTTTQTTTTTRTTTTTSSEPSGTINVATYSSYTGDGAAGNWLKQAFEEEYPDATLEFQTASNGVNEYIQRKKQGASIDADAFIGVNTGQLVTVDQELDDSLFVPIADALDNEDSVKDSLRVDPDGRAIPYDSGIISLVYNEDVLDQPPETFDDLLEDRYQGDLITQNALQSDPGRAFLLWSIKNQGEDGYLDYWQQLSDNGVSVIDDWEPAYNAYMNGEAPMVVSYSTDQVYYHGEGVNMAKHQVGFLNDQGYANPETVAVFDDSDQQEAATALVDFMLRPDVQAEIAYRNVQYPAVTGVEMPDDFSKYAYEPEETVTFTYKELAGKVDTWLEEWSRQVVGN